MKYSFDIDEKSLYRGIKNDYKKGQSATIATPLNQARSEDKWRNEIYTFLKDYPSDDVNTLPDILKDKCLNNTTSKSKCKLVYFKAFSKFTLDGDPFEVDASFAMYVKEEVSQTIIKRNGKIGPNTHLGRQRLCYPLSLNHQTDGYNIDNDKILNKIIEVNGGFAYVVNGFDVDTETKTLNFRTTMIGLKGVLLSNVFLRKKGVGSKLLVDRLLSQIGIPAEAKNKLSVDDKNTFLSTLERIRESCRISGIAGEEYVYHNIKSILKKQSVSDVKHISKDYPQSPYDIECKVDDVKMYIEVKSTKGNKKEFYMSKGERAFMEKYFNNYILVLVANVTSKHKKCCCYRKDDILNDKKMRQELQSIKYIVR